MCSIEGDAEIAQQFSGLALLLRPDLENALSQVLGRSGAHVLMRGLRGAAAWTRAAARTSVLNLSEYLAHERGDLVPRSEAEHFLRDVDDAARPARPPRSAPVASRAGSGRPDATDGFCGG